MSTNPKRSGQVRQNRKTPKFVEWHNSTLRLKFPIPEDVREYYPVAAVSRKRGAGAARFNSYARCDLKTRDLSIAEQKARRKIAELKLDFEKKRRVKLRLVAEAERWRKQIAAEPIPTTEAVGEPLTPEEMESAEYVFSARDALAYRADDLAKQIGHAAAMIFFRRASGQGASMESTLRKCLAASRRAETTKKQYKRTVEALVSWCKEHRISPNMVEIDVRRAKRFIAGRMSAKRSRRSVANERSILVNFWDWYLASAKSALKKRAGDVEPLRGGLGDNPWKFI